MDLHIAKYISLDSIGKYMTSLINMCDQVRPVSPIVTQCDSQHVCLEAMILNAAVHIC